MKKEVTVGFVNGKLVIGVGYAYNEENIRAILEMSSTNKDLYKSMLTKLLIYKALSKRLK